MSVDHTAFTFAPLHQTNLRFCFSSSAWESFHSTGAMRIGVLCFALIFPSHSMYLHA